MLYGNPQLYDRARRAKLGKLSCSGPLEELRRWVNSHFSIQVLDIVYDTIELGPHQGRPRLNLILETTEDFEKINQDFITIKPNVKRSILDRFSIIVRGCADPSRYKTDNVHLTTDDFSKEAMWQAINQFLQNDTDAVVKNFPTANIWQISGYATLFVVFFHKQVEVVNNQKNGLNDQIRRLCYRKVKVYDEFDYLNPDNFCLEFDSKENVDTNYEGSLFYYWR